VGLALLQQLGPEESPSAALAVSDGARTSASALTLKDFSTSSRRQPPQRRCV